MKKLLTIDDYREAADYVAAHTHYQPNIGLILGSGLSTLADRVPDPDIIPFADIPHFPASTVLGHAGRLVIGGLAGHQVMVMQGRAHYYEGYSMDEVTLPIRVMQLLGVKTLIVTNAAGGINPTFKAGELMLITDHINLIGMGGNNPLRGSNLDEFGPRFLDMSEAYDRELRDLALRVAKENNITLHQGVYVAMLGPTYETRAEYRMVRQIGGDAVGMSTVPEVLAARHAGMRVLGLSTITNVGLPDVPTETTGHDVLAAAGAASGKLAKIVRGVVANL